MKNLILGIFYYYGKINTLSVTSGLEGAVLSVLICLAQANGA